MIKKDILKLYEKDNNGGNVYAILKWRSRRIEMGWSQKDLKEGERTFRKG